MKLATINNYSRSGLKVRLLPHKLCFAVIFLLFMGTGAAQAAYQPDLTARLASPENAGFVGAGIFEPQAATQSLSQPAFPGTAAQYRIVVRNAGDLPDRFLLKGSWNDNGLAVRCLDDGGVDRASALAGEGYRTAALAPGEALSFLLQVTPGSLPAGASYRVALSAVSASDPAKMDQLKAETVACSLNAAVTVSTPPDAWGFPGTVVTYPYAVTNAGNTTDSFSLSLYSNTSWQSAIYADDGAGGGVAGDGVRQSGETRETVSTGALSPGASYRFFVAVSVPPASADRARVDTRLSVTGEGARTGDEVTTSAVAAVITLAESVRNLTRGGPFSPTADALPGDTLEYRMTVTNSGSAAATAVGIDTPLPANTGLLPGTLWIGTAAGGDGPPCAAAECGVAREAGGKLVAHLGEGATDSAGGTLPPGKTLHLFFRVQVE